MAWWWSNALFDPRRKRIDCCASARQNRAQYMHTVGVDTVVVVELRVHMITARHRVKPVSVATLGQLDQPGVDVRISVYRQE